CVSLRLIRRPTRRTPFPYTTLFRSAYAGTTRGITGACRLRAASAGGLRGLPAHTAVGAASAGLHREPAAAGPQRPARGGGRRRRHLRPCAPGGPEDLRLTRPAGGKPQ